MFNGKDVLLSSKELLAELENTLPKPKLQKYITKTNKTPAQLADEFGKVAELVEPASVSPGVVRDRDDAIVLAAAVGGRATHFVSGDKDLLVLRTFSGMSIVRAADMLHELSTPHDSS